MMAGPDDPETYILDRVEGRRCLSFDGSIPTPSLFRHLFAPSPTGDLALRELEAVLGLVPLVDCSRCGAGAVAALLPVHDRPRGVAMAIQSELE
jgi:hypothetical protein